MAGDTQRRLAAIVSADVVGYSRLMGVDEIATIASLRAHRNELIDPKIAEYGGRIVKTMGDGLLLEFPSVVNATQCVIEFQQGMAERNEGIDEDQRITFRVGVNIGDIIIDGEDILGDGVNVAARLQEIAAPGGVAISRRVHEDIRVRLNANFEDAGEQTLKNISFPIQVWRWSPTMQQTTSNSSLGGAPPPLHDKPSIAVLPFDNMSGDPEQEYFSDGLTEDIITGMSCIGGIFVIARNSSFTYKGSAVDVRKVGRELGVRYVLEGSVRRSGNRVRVTAQIIDTTTDAHIWADRYDGTLEDVFTLQDEIAAKVLSAVGTEITRAEMERVRRKRSDSFDAWDHYLQALQPFYDLDKAGYDEATALLQQAIDLDPKFSTAYATLARCHVLAGLHGWGASAREEIGKAEALAKRAIVLDQQDPLAHAALGWVYIFKSEQALAVSELNRAIELNPNLSIAQGLLSVALAFLGRSEEAIAAGDLADRGSPRDPERFTWYIGIMNAHLAEQRYEQAAAAAQQAIILQPNFYGGQLGLAESLALLGRVEEAKRAMLEARKLQPRLTIKGVLRNPLWVPEEVVARIIEAMRIAGCPEE